LAEGSLPSGISYAPDFISAAESTELIAKLDLGEWSQELKRRVQHFGFRYNYKTRSLTAADRIGPLPKWAADLSERLVDRGYFATVPDQVIVNEYLPGQGISPHIDLVSCFGPVVASLSLGSSIVMDFDNADGEKGRRLLAPGSLIVLAENARYTWRHGIAGRKSDSIGASTLPRSRRLSVTFRTVVLDL
jgi:alkylated DNA repair dioxygenase AlkB